MPDREKSTLPPPPPLETERDRMLGHTWAWEFDEPEVPDLLAWLGDKVLEYAREGHLWGGPATVPGIPRALNAITADLDSLGGCLDEVAAQPAESEVSREELMLCHPAHVWSGQLREFADEIRRATATPE